MIDDLYQVRYQVPGCRRVKGEKREVSEGKMLGYVIMQSAVRRIQRYRNVEWCGSGEMKCQGERRVTGRRAEECC
jgi:hypothetical protein